MNEVVNCLRCGALYMKNYFRSVCPQCDREEEALYMKTHAFLRKRENRAASVDRIVEVIGVKKEMVYSWVRKGRLHPVQFPNLSYPCDYCGTFIQQGKICGTCLLSMQQDLEQYDREQEFKKIRSSGFIQTYKRKRVK